MNLSQFTRHLFLLATLAGLTACGGGGGGSSGNAAAQGSNVDSGCTGSCATSSPANLTIADVQKVISQAVQEANALGKLATIAVTDRVGNVLAVFQMNGAATTFTIQSTIVNGTSGLENINLLPSTYAAIAKAISGSYLASEGNAFSTRTASHIVQEHFSPHETGQPGGPLFGVQFSQLPCGDLVQQGTAIDIGPRRSPLGISADPGGFPLYKNGHPVGGIGIIADSRYSLDRNILDDDNANAANPILLNIDEIIAVAGQFGYAPPTDRQANRITLDGRTARYSDADTNDLASAPASAPAYAGNVGGGAGQGVLVDSDATGGGPNYFIAAGGIRAGTTFGMQDSGIQAAGNTNAAADYAGLDAFVLTATGTNNNRYPPTLGALVNGQQLTVAEVLKITRSALDVANRARAQIRRPLNSQARVTISIVDANGAILAVTRTRDAPMFGTDVSLQKARTATFFSSTDAGTVLNNLNAANAVVINAALTYNSSIADYVGSIASGKGVRAFLNDDTALANGISFADRSGGNLSRPFYPDGTDANTNGPFSKSYSTNAATNLWSPFSTGLQLDLVYNSLVDHLGTGANETDCTGDVGGANSVGGVRLANGIQIFPGSVPIYKNGVLVGGIGVSGDGVDQDDMISFLGLYNASVALGGDGIGNSVGEIGNAITTNRADTITPNGFATALRYIQCPQNPFIGSSDNNVCQGK